MGGQERKKKKEEGVCDRIFYCRYPLGDRCLSYHANLRRATTPNGAYGQLWVDEDLRRKTTQDYLRHFRGGSGNRQTDNLRLSDRRRALRTRLFNATSHTDSFLEDTQCCGSDYV